MQGSECTDAELPIPNVPPGQEEFAKAVLQGLGATVKSLPSHFLYDQRGSELFEQICDLPEYYPTRTETKILKANADDMTRHVPAGSILVEFGSGSSQKTEILLQAMPDLYAYVPIDVSQSALNEAGARLKGRFPELNIHPICADFTKPTTLPANLLARPRIGFFPGSTIGNFEHGEARALLDTFRVDLQPGGRLIVGVDLLKDRAVLQLAYDDPAGVTADFNLNILARINRAFGAPFDLDAFNHEARFNEAKGRIEMHLVSTREQTIKVLGQSFMMRAGETIHTENSHKYTIAHFGELAQAAGWRTSNVWTDKEALFSVHELLTD